MKHSVPTSKVGSYGRQILNRCLILKAPRLSLDARLSGEIRKGVSRVRRESRKALPPEAKRIFTAVEQREKNQQLNKLLHMGV